MLNIYIVGFSDAYAILSLNLNCCYRFVTNEMSENTIVEYEVPQGSVLGPVLFSCTFEQLVKKKPSFKHLYLIPYG